MTREKIIKKIEEYSIKHYSCDPAIKYEWWEISDTDKAGLADELLSMLEQEKKEVAKEILQDLKEHIAYESKPFIKWGSDNPKDEIPDACIDSDILNNKIDEIAKEYEVEL